MVLVGEISDLEGSKNQNQFLAPEVMGMFSFHTMPSLGIIIISIPISMSPVNGC